VDQWYGMVSSLVPDRCETRSYFRRLGGLSVSLEQFVFFLNNSIPAHVPIKTISVINPES